MSRGKEMPRSPGDLVAVEPSMELVVAPPASGVVGRFLEETRNMFKARAMRMSAQLARINDSGQRTEKMLRMAAGMMEAAELRLEQDLRKQGLLSDPNNENDLE